MGEPDERREEVGRISRLVSLWSLSAAATAAFWWGGGDLESMGHARAGDFVRLLSVAPLEIAAIFTLVARRSLLALLALLAVTAGWIALALFRPGL
jgi:hypothetical protein